MIFKKIALIGTCAFMLAACGNNDDSANESNSGSTKDTDYSSQNNSINHGITDTKQDSTSNTSEDQTKSDSSTTKENTGNDQATTNSTTTNDDDEKVGFELNSDGKVDEAKSVPADEKKAILALFDEYIDSFNDKDINRYTKTLSENPKGFKLDEEIDYTKQAFKDYDVKRTAENVTIKKYKENYAEVFANIKTTVKQDDQTFTQPLNQVTVMAKENSKWGISAVYVMGTKE